MNTLVSPPLKGCRDAFSLIEVTIAIGIVAFSLVAMLGLIGVGLQSSRQSADDTAVAQIIIQVLSENTGQNTVPVGKSRSIAFTVDGTLCAPESTEIFYRCELTAYKVDPLTIAGVEDRLALLSLTIASVSGTKTIHSTAIQM